MKQTKQELERWEMESIEGQDRSRMLYHLTANLGTPLPSGWKAADVLRPPGLLYVTICHPRRLGSSSADCEWLQRSSAVFSGPYYADYAVKGLRCVASAHHIPPIARRRRHATSGAPIGSSLGRRGSSSVRPSPDNETLITFLLERVYPP